jgi:hypothetical protein
MENKHKKKETQLNEVLSSLAHLIAIKHINIKKEMPCKNKETFKR